MGQRLLMHFTTTEDDKKKHDIATVWSHWGGYTQDAIEYTDKFLMALDDVKTLFPKSSLMNLFLLAVGSSTDCGIEEEDKEKASSAVKTYDPTILFPCGDERLMKKPGSDKNVLTIYPNDGADNRQDSEMDLIIFLDTMHADVHQLYDEYYSIKELNEDRDTKIHLKDINMPHLIQKEINIDNAPDNDIALLHTATAANGNCYVIMNGSSKLLLGFSCA